jgi:hypothetical protein
LGYKLGKMVKKIFIIISLSFVFTSSAVETVNLKLINLSDKEFSTEKDAQIYTLVGNKNNLELKAKRIAKPSNKSLQLLKLVTPRDKYAIKVLDANGKDIMFIGIGNPFYIYADHIGYEDKNVHGGFIETEFELPISLNISASQIILLSQSEFGFKEIKRLDIN